MDLEKTTFTFPFETYAFRICQSIHGRYFRLWKLLRSLPKNLDKMLQRFKDENLVLKWEKCYFMVNEGIVLGHKESGAGLEFGKAKIDVDDIK
ncbi:hypothetical protein Tco_0160936 [Tanacetum coccineum]